MQTQVRARKLQVTPSKANARIQTATRSSLITIQQQRELKYRVDAVEDTKGGYTWLFFS